MARRGAAVAWALRTPDTCALVSRNPVHPVVRGGPCLLFQRNT